MELIYTGIAVITLIIMLASYAVAKQLHATKLFLKSIFSFVIIVGILGAVIFRYFDIQIQDFHQAENEFPRKMPFAVKETEDQLHYYESFSEAVFFAKQLGGNSPVFYQDEKKIVWEKVTGIPSTIIQVPLILQGPELQRGTEIASLAMLLNYAGVNVNKLELANKIKKDPTPLKIEDEKIHFGDPNIGFVGNIYSIEQPGFGVYHGPIRELAEHYLPDQIIDMTGAEFEDILYPLYLGQPVWAIVHSQFKTLPDSAFQTWTTPSGDIWITKFHHAVLITGMDEKNIYYNDPTSQEVNRPVLKEDFKAAWIQMGSQAISYVKDDLN